ncbi:hypothetical protein D3C72_2389180 [compost metagenome]
MVGGKSSAVPTAKISAMITSISSTGLPTRGCSISATTIGMLAAAMSQAETCAAATRNITTAEVLALASSSP